MGFNYLTFMLALVLLINLVSLILILGRYGSLKRKLESFEVRNSTLDENVNSRLKEFREDLNSNFRNFREESQSSFKNLSEIIGRHIEALTENQRNKFEDFNKMLAEDVKKGEERSLVMQNIIKESLSMIIKSHDKFTEEVSKTIKELTLSMKSELGEVKSELGKSLKSFEEKVDLNLERMRRTITEVLEKLREDNEKKLEEMRKTVDEKLHETLEMRLSNSFKVVSERLEQVHKGLGEMQSLANGVGDLKRALTNVKNRGIIGEVQLKRILEQILYPGQYVENVKTKPTSNDVVEFAVKLPGDDEKSQVWLPIDSKFPVEDYYRLLDSIEDGDVQKIQLATKQLENRVKQSAKDISSKYIEVPFTTDFAIMFVPFEGLYSEVLRINGLFESIQRDYKVVITGPTTMAAFLNSLQMGFKTLSVEKSAHKVMNLLAVVKSEFIKFGDVLEKAQKKIKEAGDNIDNLVGVRTRKIQKALEDVEISADKSIDEI
ncbi:DNA recombination protein RmuC [Deferribacterales bacterium Es71-Z0220]|uniref:DNA recombination protein RmuC n=1 Tax=Deferrivibrio essentukiensis TaxID=2880922 RepID=UPI001F6198F1|nr:DNA recombination protein RmuC [Deferrivibrio essentukiensis]MBZ4643774.1 recombination protein RmuC [Deferribacteraceae bacterium]MCB4204253.1 DNA recombination protein RmuC [Deferrivibrio essentukiensis]